MKNLRLLAFSLLGAGVMFTTSCSDDEEDPIGPVLSVSETNIGADNGVVEAEPGDVLRFEWEAREGDARLDMFRIFRDGVPTAVVTEDGHQMPWQINSANNNIYTDAYVDTLNNTGSVEYTFEVEDRDGLTESRTIEVNVATSTPMANEVTGAFFHVAGTSQGAYDLVSETQRAVSDPDGDKDMINTDEAGEPFTGSWESGAGNNTTFVKDNSFDYANASVEAASQAYSAGNSSSNVEDPAEGDVYIAQLRGGSEYAVIRITTVDPTDNTCNCGNLGKIEFDFKKE